jgi:spermidine synthase
MAHRTLIAQSLTPDQESLTLSLEEGHHVVRVRGEVLMSSRVSGSEQALARLAFAETSGGQFTRVLVGGLGMGFTVLDELDASAQVEVLELLAPVVEWNRGVLAAYANQPLLDPRVEIIVADVMAHLKTPGHVYDAIILDIDNGPEAFTVAANHWLYTPAGLAVLYAALREGGVMVLWSAFRSPRFERLLRAAGFSALSVTARARGAIGKGARHTLFKGTRPGS